MAFRGVKTARAIAAEIGLSRNAVIGIWNRHRCMSDRIKPGPKRDGQSTAPGYRPSIYIKTLRALGNSDMEIAEALKISINDVRTGNPNT